MEPKKFNSIAALIEDENMDDGIQFPEMIGRSAGMRDVYAIMKKVASSDSTVIITGESGTGKGLAAKAIHGNSRRKHHPFVTINCGAIPQNLLESELFGHVKGAFTGATASKQGKFARADKGVVFLDEVGDMSPELQVKLLRVLEEREFEPVGGNDPVRVDVRVLAATHRNLEEEVLKENFRHDLYYRLYVIPIRLPELRRRKSDIPLLINHFLDLYNERNQKQVSGISDDALALMINYPWPGNVRELKNVVERLVVLKEDGSIGAEDLPEKFYENHDIYKGPKVEISDDGICLNTAVNEFEKALILQSLEKSKWVKNKAAKLLQLNRTTLVEKIKRHHIQ